MPTMAWLLAIAMSTGCVGIANDDVPVTGPSTGRSPAGSTSGLPTNHSQDASASRGTPPDKWSESGDSGDPYVPFEGDYDAGRFGSTPSGGAATDTGAANGSDSNGGGGGNQSDAATGGVATTDTATHGDAASTDLVNEGPQAGQDAGLAGDGEGDGLAALGNGDAGDTWPFGSTGPDAGMGGHSGDGNSGVWVDDATSDVAGTTDAGAGDSPDAIVKPDDLPAPFTFDKSCEACSMACSDDSACTFDAKTVAGPCIHITYTPQCKTTATCGSSTLCDGEYCVGHATDCADGDPCTADACDPYLGVCANVPIPGCKGLKCGKNADCPYGSFCARTGRCTPILPKFQPLGPVRIKPKGVRRVMSYNVLLGLSMGTPGYNPNRRKHAFAWFKAMNIDVLAFQELNGVTPAALTKAAKGWGHNYAVVAGKTAYKLGLTASKPLKDCAYIGEGFTIGVLSCRVENVVYLVSHLHPYSLNQRKKETMNLGKLVNAAKKQGHEVIVLGDLNSVSPYDQGIYAVESPYFWFAKHAPKGQPPGSLDSTVLITLAVFGLSDMQSQFQPGTLVRPTSTVANAPWGVRIDFIMASAKIAANALGAWVADAPQRRSWSDHFPVVLDYKAFE
ncbi:MAG: endonuclease/exonuclease/phosphatase family protein [Myxococcales bacterium]|nr:endonuclease/exonuclease/phosphatase family protein [Myxococcales bacterium]